MPNRKYLDNLSYAAMLSLDNGRSTGSGFCIKSESNFYLITAKHNLFDANGILRCTTLAVTFQDSKGSQLNAEIFEIDMNSAKTIPHSMHDVALVMLGRQEEERIVLENYVTKIQSGGIQLLQIDIADSRSMEEVRIANNVFLIGYPTSLLFSNMSAAIPLLRKGIIAGFDIASNIFIVDCPAYYGNSGSAVIEECEDGVLRLIGVISRYIPFVVEWKNPREPSISNTEYLNSGYTICTPADAIKELLGIQPKKN